MSFTPAQIRMSRALLDQTHIEFSQGAGVDQANLSKFCTGKADNLTQKTISKISDYLSKQGVELGENDMVRRKTLTTRSLYGREGFRQLYEELYASAQQEGMKICLYNAISEQVIEGLGEDYVELQKKRMTAIKNRFVFQVIVKEGDDTFFGADYCEYKWMPKELFRDETFYVFGNKVAFIDFKPTLTITIFEHEGQAESHAMLFDLAWNHSAKKPYENA